MGSSESSYDGYFPPGSVLRRVMRERAVNLLYGQRALMVGALNPVAFIGTTQRTSAHDRPWKRLVHTAAMFDAVFFGTRAEADKALSFVGRLHERVKGTIGEQAGPYGPDTRYDAFDPALMVWVTAPVFDSALVLHETFVRRLSPGERDELYAESVRWGELFGMPPSAMPPDYAAFREWWPDQLTNERAFLTRDARAVGLNIALRMPGPAPAVPALRLAGFLIVGSLPRSVREAYGINWGLREQIAFDAAARAVRLSRPLVPARLRRGSSADAYALIQRTERDRVRSGRRSFALTGRGT